MIKTALKHKLFELCIDTFFRSLTKNVMTVPVLKPDGEGDIYKLGGEIYFVDDATGSEFFYDEDVRVWVNIHDHRDCFIDEILYQACCNADLEDILDEDTGSFSWIIN